MSTINEQVMRQVEDELRARPNIPDGILFALAVQTDPSLESMDPRTFHAHYVAPARQAANPVKRRPRKPRPSRRVPAPPPARMRTPRARRAGSDDPPLGVAALSSSPEPGGSVEPVEPVEPVAPAPLQAATGSTGRSARPDRDRVRAALLAFAVEFAAAERAVELVGVFERIDDFVDRALAGGG